MLDKTLQHIVDRKYTSAREVGELVGVSTSTVYRWMSGESQPDFHSIRLLLRHIGHPKAQEAILSVFAAGTHWQFVHNRLDLDANQDGEVNADDALDAACGAVRSAAESLSRIRTLCRDETVTAEDMLEMISLLDRASRKCTVARRVLVEVSDRRREQKQGANPLRIAE